MPQHAEKANRRASAHASPTALSIHSVVCLRDAGGLLSPGLSALNLFGSKQVQTPRESQPHTNDMAPILSREIITNSDDSESQSSGGGSLQLRAKTKKYDTKKRTALSKSNQTTNSATGRIPASESSASESEGEAQTKEVSESGDTCTKLDF